MPFANNTLNLSPSVVNTPLVNAGITLANAEITATTTEASVTVGDDYFNAYLVVAVPYITLTSIRIQVYTSDTNANITSTGTLIYDSQVQTAAFATLVPLANLVPSVIPGSGPQPQAVINQYCQVVLTVAGSGVATASVVLLV